jgi:hypothetical protein
MDAMIVEFTVKYNTETGRFQADPNNEDTKIVESGSSYLRVYSEDCYGTISCRRPDYDKEGRYNHMQIAIETKKDDK